MFYVKNLFYKQGDFCLDISEWKFPSQGITVLKGVSGCGKTTVLKILSGLLECPSLVFTKKDRCLSNLPSPQRGIAFCFQDLRLFPVMTAQQNLLFALQARKLSLKQSDYERIITALNLKNCLKLFVEDLSGGEKQRLALARALLVPQDLLFLDEPFSYLDENHKQKARNLVQDFSRERSMPILLVSHEQEILSNRAFLLKKGKIQELSPSCP